MTRSNFTFYLIIINDNYQPESNIMLNIINRVNNIIMQVIII